MRLKNGRFPGILNKHHGIGANLGGIKMPATTESRFVLSARCILADIAARLPLVERNPVAAGDLQEDLQALLRLVDETMPQGSQLDPFEPVPTVPDGSALGYSPALLPPED